MGLFRPSRERRGPDPYYHGKVILFAIGAAFGLGAMITERDWLIWIAVPVLTVGVALRWLPGGTARRSDVEEAPEDADAEQEEPPQPPPPV